MVISDGLGGVARFAKLCNNIEFACYTIVNLTKNVLLDEFNIAFEMFSEVISQSFDEHDNFSILLKLCTVKGNKKISK